MQSQAVYADVECKCVRPGGSDLLHVVVIVGSTGSIMYDTNLLRDLGQPDAVNNKDLGGAMIPWNDRKRAFFVDYLLAVDP